MDMNKKGDRLIMAGSGTFSLAGLYADSVIRGERIFSQLPKVMKAPVKAILIEKGYEHLVDE